MISNVTIVFKILAQKCHILVLKNQKSFGVKNALFHNILGLDKFTGSDFKYDMKEFLSFKIDNKSNSFLVNYCIVKWPKRH